MEAGSNISELNIGCYTCLNRFLAKLIILPLGSARPENLFFPSSLSSNFFEDRSRSDHHECPYPNRRKVRYTEMLKSSN